MPRCRRMPIRVRIIITMRISRIHIRRMHVSLMSISMRISMPIIISRMRIRRMRIRRACARSVSRGGAVLSARGHSCRRLYGP